MNKLLVFALSTILLISGLPANAAVEKLDLRIEIGEHPYLPGYGFGETGVLGDLWIFEIEVLDSDGDPAEGAKVRIYNGKKSVGTGRADFEGIAKIRLSLQKLGVQNLRIIASEDEPSGRGEAKFTFEIVKSKTLQAVNIVVGIQASEPNEARVVLDGQAIVNAGCKDMNKLWTGSSVQWVKSGNGVASATWPFNKSKIKVPLDKSFSTITMDEIITFQNTTFPLVDDYSKPGYIIAPDDHSLPVGSQILCQAESGELLIIK